MSKIQVCPICGIQKIDGTFRFSYKPSKPVSDAEVFSKVCRRVVKPGCINSSTEYSSNLDYPEVTDAPSISSHTS
jgi:hypothetical protein